MLRRAYKKSGSVKSIFRQFS